MTEICNYGDGMTPRGNKQRVWRLTVLACLPFVLSACAHSLADDERSALLRKSAEVDRSYLNYFRGPRSDNLSKRRLKSIVALIKRIENISSFAIVERGLEDALKEADRIYDADAKELCDVIHFAGAFYEKHSQSEKSEQLYRRHIDLLISPHKQSDLPNLNLEPQVATAVSEDMKLLAALLDKKGQHKEARNYRQQALLLSAKTGDKTDAVAALRLAGDLAVSRGEDAEAQIDYERMVETATVSKNQRLRHTSLMHYGKFLELRDMRAAVAVFETAIKDLEAAGQEIKPENRAPYLRTASAQLSSGNFERAEKLLQKSYNCALLYRSSCGALDTARGTKAFREANSFLLRVLVRTAETYTYKGKYKEAEDCFQRALKVEGLQSMNPDELAFLYEQWSLKSWLSGDSTKAREFFAKAVQQRSRLATKEKDYLLQSINLVARTYGKTSQAKPDATLSAANRVLDAMKAQLGPDNLYYVAMIKRLSDNFDSAGNKDGAKALNQRAEVEKMRALKNVPGNTF